MNTARRCRASVLLLTVPALAACDPDATSPREAGEGPASSAALAASRSQPFPVSGSSVIFAATEIVHSQEPTETGMIQRSTVAGQLTGDVSGSILFHPTSVFDFDSGTLVNTGTQFFVGTVAGSEPVVLHDDRFRFDIDLNTFETVGTVHLSRSSDAPHKGGWFECDLVVVGTGITAEGDIASDYSGTCVRRGNLN
jgi:hypothetical protein